MKKYTSMHMEHVVQKIMVSLLVISCSQTLVSGDQTPTRQASPGFFQSLTSDLTPREIASVAALKAQTLKILNSRIPNFAQQVRTTKKSLETSLQYINKIIATLGIADTMSVDEAEAHSKYLENEIKKLEEQKRLAQSAETNLTSLTTEQIRQEIQSGQIVPADLTNKQIEEAYGTAEEVN